MKLDQLKASIENGKIGNSLLILQYSENSFVAHQYVKEIAKQKQLHINYLDSIESIERVNTDIFGLSNQIEQLELRVYSCDNFESISINLIKEVNLIIITKKISAAAKKIFESYIYEIPKLEDWQIKDYVYSNAEGIDRNNLDWFISICQNDIYRIENELDKLRLFNENERKFLFDDMVYQGAFSDSSNYNVFNITNSVTNRDMQTLAGTLKEIKSFDAEPLGVVTLLYQGFRKLIQVWLAKNPTQENTGLPSKMIYAINKSPRTYTKEQLLNCFLMLTNIDKQLKSGEIEIPWLIDYVICKCLTA